MFSMAEGELLLFGYLLIEVWDYDKVNQDDFLGRIVVPLCDVPPGSDKDDTYPITRKGVKDVVRGTIRVKLRLCMEKETVSFGLITFMEKMDDQNSVMNVECQFIYRVSVLPLCLCRN